MVTALTSSPDNAKLVAHVMMVFNASLLLNLILADLITKRAFATLHLNITILNLDYALIL